MDSNSTALIGKRIVVTRAPEQARDLIRALESMGAEVLSLPTIAFAEVEDTSPLDIAIAEMDKFDWVFLTSRNVVKFVASRFAALRIPIERVNKLLLSPQVAVIGSATSEQAWCVGFIPDYEATESRGEALAAELLDQVKGKRVLLPRSDRADSRLPDLLRQSGADVVEVIAYRTVRPQTFDLEVLEALRNGEVDAITLFSPSAYEYLVDEIGLEPLRLHSGKIVIASIGPTTSQAVRQDGLEVAVEAPTASAGALCGAIAAYFRQRASGGTANK